MSRVTVIGGHGKVALLAAPLLVADGHEVTSVVRNPEHVADVEATGATAAVLDIEHASTDEVAVLLRGSDVVVWSAGAGGGSPGRTYAVDRDAAKFHGVISTQTPTGSRSVVTSMPGGTIDDRRRSCWRRRPSTRRRSPRGRFAAGGVDRLAAVACLEACEDSSSRCADEERGLGQDPAALAGARPRPRPFLEPLDGHVDRAMRVLGSRLRHLGHRHGRAGLDHLERLALGGGDQFPADHQQLRHAPLLRDVTKG